MNQNTIKTMLETLRQYCETEIVFTFTEKMNVRYDAKHDNYILTDSTTNQIEIFNELNKTQKAIEKVIS